MHVSGGTGREVSLCRTVERIAWKLLVTIDRGCSLSDQSFQPGYARFKGFDKFAFGDDSGYSAGLFESRERGRERERERDFFARVSVRYESWRFSQFYWIKSFLPLKEVLTTNISAKFQIKAILLIIINTIDINCINNNDILILVLF